MKFISEKLKEPLILERSEWTERSWNTFERVFDCIDAERIVIKGATIEACIKEITDEDYC